MKSEEIQRFVVIFKSLTPKFTHLIFVTIQLPFVGRDNTHNNSCCNNPQTNMIAFKLYTYLIFGKFFSLFITNTILK